MHILPATMRAKVRLVRYHQDPRAGWIEVPRFELERLQLDAKITADSHELQGTVYLPEDTDGRRYLEALRDQGIKYRLCHCRLDFDHPIRSMPHYAAPAA